MSFWVGLFTGFILSLLTIVFILLHAAVDDCKENHTYLIENDGDKGISEYLAWIFLIVVLLYFFNTI